MEIVRIPLELHSVLSVEREAGLHLTLGCSAMICVGQQTVSLQRQRAPQVICNVPVPTPPSWKRLKVLICTPFKWKKMEVVAKQQHDSCALAPSALWALHIDARTPESSHFYTFYFSNHQSPGQRSLP